jgi:hypothetical protein
MLYEVLGDIWVVQRNPLPGRRPAGQPQAPAALIDALHHRLARSSKRRTPRMTTPTATPWWASCWWPPGAVEAFAAHFRDVWDLRKAAPRAGRHTAKDNIKFDGLSRVSHVTDATDWRVEYPFVVLTPTPRPRWRRWCRAASTWA